MKKLALLILAPAIVIVLGFMALLYFNEEVPDQQVVACGLAVDPAFESASMQTSAQAAWTVSRDDGTDRAPAVKVSGQTFLDTPENIAQTGCELQILAIPSAQARDGDWRIGHSIENIEHLRGKAIRARFALKAETAARFGTASVYVYDGRNVADAIVTSLDTEWKLFDVIHNVPEDAEKLELWFRLMIDRPDISPDRNKISMVAQISESDELQVLAKQFGYVGASCPLRITGSGSTVLANENADRWFIYRYEGSGAPNVRVTPESTNNSGNTTRAWCTLDVTNGSATGGSGVDWRLGHLFDVAQLRGKRVRFSAQMKSAIPTRMSSASLYSYDGKNLSQAPVPELGPDWQEFAFTAEVPEDAETFQTWFRLAFDNGTINPESTQILFAPEIEIIGE